MEQLVCERCGGNDFLEKDGYRICKYCDTKSVIRRGNFQQKSSSIDLSDDIKKLIQKCQEDPKNALRYASLILDIDPNNGEARTILHTIDEGRK